MRAAIYTRQSLDKAGEGAAVARQESECRDLCERHGWAVAKVYIDNDRSATKGFRPAWAELLADLRGGRYDVLVCWHTDRLYRRLRDLVDLVEIAEQRPLRISTVRASEIDLSTPAGRMLAGMLGSAARYEAEQKGARQVAANRQRASRGTVLWTRRPFGYDRDGHEIRVVPDEAREISRAAQRVLEGATLTSIADDLNARGVPTSIGGRWTVTGVRRVLLNPRLSGRAVYRGEDMGTARGRLTILRPEVAERVAATLRDPARKVAPASLNVKHLLSGLVRCGRDGCGDAPMFATSNPKQVLVYRCLNCYGTRRLDRVDEVVVGVLRARLMLPDAAAALTPAGEDVEGMQAELVELRARRDGLASLLAEGLLPADAVREQAGKLTARIEDLTRELGAATGSSPLAAVVAADDVEAALAGLDILALRDVIRTLMVVRILPAGRGVRFAPEQVPIEWRGPQ